MPTDDDDERPPRSRRPESRWGDDQRAIIGLAARRRTASHGIPVIVPGQDDDRTPVFDLTEPLTAAEGHEIIRYLKSRLGERPAIQSSGPSEDTLALQRAVEELQRSAKTSSWIMKAVAIAVLGGLIGFVDRIWSRAQHEAETGFRLERLERDLDRLTNRRSNATTPPQLPAPTSDSVSQASSRTTP